MGGHSIDRFEWPQCLVSWIQKGGGRSGPKRGVLEVSEVIKPKVFDPSHQCWQSIGPTDKWLTALKTGLGCEKQSWDW